MDDETQNGPEMHNTENLQPGTATSNTQIQDLQETDDELRHQIKELQEHISQIQEQIEDHQKLIEQLQEQLNKCNSPISTSPQPQNRSHLQKERGALPPLEYNILKEHRVEMVEQLKVNDIQDHLYQNGLIDLDELKILTEKQGKCRKEGVDEMLDFVHYSGKSGFDKFTRALNAAGYTQIGSTLIQDLHKKKGDPNASEVKKERGSIGDIEMEVIQDNYLKLVNDLDPEILKDYLFQYDVIDRDQLESMNTKFEKGRKENVELMLNFVSNAGKNAFPKLIRCLNEAGYKELGLKLSNDFQQKEIVKDFTKNALPEIPSPDLTGIEVDDVDTIINRVEEWQKSRTDWYKSHFTPWCKKMASWFTDHHYTSRKDLQLAMEQWIHIMAGDLETDKEGEVKLYKYLLDKDNDIIDRVTNKCEFLEKCRNKDELREEMEKLTTTIDSKNERFADVLGKFEQNIKCIIEDQQEEIGKIGKIGWIYMVNCDNVLEDFKQQWKQLKPLNMKLYNKSGTGNNYNSALTDEIM